jgi:hypothetical protein
LIKGVITADYLHLATLQGLPARLTNPAVYPLIPVCSYFSAYGLRFTRVSLTLSMFIVGTH